MMITIDLNCDMGEDIGNDELIMPFISSASIACGYHAGNEKTMEETVDLCIKYNVAIGAHPSFADKENFGRTEINLSPDKIYQLITEQLTILSSIVKKKGAKLHHVKPHGALYNMAAKDISIAATIAKAVKDFDATLVLYGLAGSHSINEAKNAGLKTASEVFADRSYQDDGSLTPRKQPGALIEDEGKAIAQVLQMIHEKKAISLSGKQISIAAETICLHGDGKHAVNFAKKIAEAMQENKIQIRPI